MVLLVWDSLSNPLRCIAIFLGSLLLGWPVLNASAQPGPVGNWDCVLGGNERGVAQLFFNADGSLSGRALFTFTGRAVATYTNRGVLYTNFLGGAYLLGQWSYASPTTTNRIVGIINGVSSPAGSTTLTTNGLSFHGLVGRSKLTLLAVGYQGNVSFQGIRLRATNDLTGGYYATGQKRGAPTPFVE